MEVPVDISKNYARIVIVSLEEKMLKTIDVYFKTHQIPIGKFFAILILNFALCWLLWLFSVDLFYIVCWLIGSLTVLDIIGISWIARNE